MGDSDHDQQSPLARQYFQLHANRRLMLSIFMANKVEFAREMLPLVIGLRCRRELSVNKYFDLVDTIFLGRSLPLSNGDL